MDFDIKYMRRALQLARCGRFDTAPNPMVGAVVVCQDKIIGEGYHRRHGEAHAEVNAIVAVKDRSLLTDSTIYVTLEPCSHYGKTPPCAQLIIDSGIPRVVVGSLDPNERVSGQGIAMLRKAGIEVVTGILDNECRQLNRRFITAHTLRRPYIALKWAQSIDGFIDSDRPDDAHAARLSSPLTATLMHRYRACHEAIMVGSNTLRRDRPALTVRLWDGRNPRRIDATHNLPRLLSQLFDQGITSLLVEGGALLLQSFIDAGLYDEIRVETAPFRIHRGIKAPHLSSLIFQNSTTLDDRTISYYFRNLEDLSK